MEKNNKKALLAIIISIFITIFLIALGIRSLVVGLVVFGVIVLVAVSIFLVFLIIAILSPHTLNKLSSKNATKYAGSSKNIEKIDNLELDEINDIIDEE